MATLIGLLYDPHRFRETRELVPGPLADGSFNAAHLYLRYGKINFLLTEASITALNQVPQYDRADRLMFIARPGESGLERHAQPVYEVRIAHGQAKLWIFELQL